MDVTARALVARREPFVLDVAAFRAGAGGTALLGPNGAGKTTLLLALHGLIPAAGEIDRPARCAAVFARPAILRGTTLWNAAVATTRLPATGSADQERRARFALDQVGLGNVADVDARTLSTGQRQRLAIARALAREPDALFLDEPFANIDADARPMLRAVVAGYARRTNCAVILATSSFADAAAVCQDAVVLAAGGVAAAGAISELRTGHDPYVAALVADASVPA